MSSPNYTSDASSSFSKASTPRNKPLQSLSSRKRSRETMGDCDYSYVYGGENITEFGIIPPPPPLPRSKKSRWELNNTAADTITTSPIQSSSSSEFLAQIVRSDNSDSMFPEYYVYAIGATTENGQSIPAPPSTRMHNIAVHNVSFITPKKSSSAPATFSSMVKPNTNTSAATPAAAAAPTTSVTTPNTAPTPAFVSNYISTPSSIKVENPSLSVAARASAAKMSKEAPGEYYSAQDLGGDERQLHNLEVELDVLFLNHAKIRQGLSSSSVDVSQNSLNRDLLSLRSDLLESIDAHLNARITSLSV